MVSKKSQFNKICKDIKNIKIQGANNVAKAGFRAYKLIPSKTSKQKILSLRPTEPMLENVLKLGDRVSYRELVNRLTKNQDEINKEIYKLIKNNSVIFTHCHSSSVVNSLIYCKKKGKKFEVYNTETRPLFQGRKTARELKKAKIKTTMFVDSAASVALTSKPGTKKANLMLIGADAITKKGVINKIGSNMFAQVAKKNKIPVYVVADSLKYSDKKIKIEERGEEEVWSGKIKGITIRNPAFSLIERKNISGIISELGKLNYNQFLRKVG